MNTAWLEFLDEVKNEITSNTDFTDLYGDRVYLYRVPDDLTYPYMSRSFDMTLEQWMTISDVQSGFNFNIRFLLHTHLVEGGGVEDLEKGIDALSDTFHLKDSFSGLSNWSLISMRDVNSGSPFPDPNEDYVYHCFEDYRIRLEKS